MIWRILILTVTAGIVGLSLTAISLASSPCFNTRKQFVAVDGNVQYQPYYAAPSYGGSYNGVEDLLRRILERLDSIESKLGEQAVRNLSAESIITTRCASCHNPKKSEGGFVIVEENGKPSLLSAESRRLAKKLISTTDAEIRMPKTKPPLVAEEKRILVEWLDRVEMPKE